MTDSANDCSGNAAAGGNWPINAPFSGGPYPQRTWARFIPNCPDYNQYSKEDLDMKRKAEVLLYKKNTGGQHYTKKHRYAFFAKHPRTTHINETFSPTVNNNSIQIYKPLCINPASASDVPGKKLLFNKPDVPITMLTGTRRMAEGTTEENVKWRTNLSHAHANKHDIETDYNNGYHRHHRDHRGTHLMGLFLF